MKISVIVPTYNSENYIKTCLEHLENQTFKDFEIIIVDDCSKDNTLKVINSFMAQTCLSLIVIQNKCNLGPGESRNRGIEAANGDYLCFCDSDDWYEPNYLEKMVEKSDGNDIVFCGFKQVFKKNKKKIFHFCNMPTGLSKDTLLTANVDSLCRILIKKEIAKKHQIPKLKNGEDMAIIPVWIVNSDGYGVVNDCIYNYFCLRKSISNNLTKKSILDAKESYLFIFKNISDIYFKEKEFLSLRNYLYGAVLGLRKLTNDKEELLKIIEDFEKTFPNWAKNPYISSLPLYKRFFLKWVRGRNFIMISFFCKMHKLLIA